METISAREMLEPEWMAAMETRRSRRSYTGDEVEPGALDALEQHCERFVPSESARTLLIREAPADIFVGILGSYGRIKGAPSALVFLGQAGDGVSMAAAGYTGEAAVLEATRLGLDTCWVGGFFRAGRVARLIKMKAGEQVYGVSPVGYAEESLSGAERTVYRMSRPKPRRSLEDIAPGWRAWPAWTHSAVEAARIAPSAMNRQPWRFRFDAGRLAVAFDGADTPKTSKRLDCGIGMLHAEIGAHSKGVSGHWEFADHGSEVAAFVLE